MGLRSFEKRNLHDPDCDGNRRAVGGGGSESGSPLMGSQGELEPGGGYVWEGRGLNRLATRDSIRAVTSLHCLLPIANVLASRRACSFPVSH